jgi:U3 small nucleolar ribonucleoprotein protein IMP4
MTFVTTSRKALPGVRSLAKDLAFAAGCSYQIRGKAGLNTLNSQDISFLIMSTEYLGTRFRCFSGGEPVADYLVTEISFEERTDPIRKGVFVSDQSVYDSMKPYIPVILSGEGSGSVTFDGTRRRRYLLRLAPNGA